ncbi:MAG TPA: hypothetical protein VN418_05600 [Gammaproteobacteria bacterium]|nr:hypothetical protein [Gammaproteobacteria bacterium]
MSHDINPPVLSEAHATFIQYRVTMNVAARDASLITTITRALGCRVSDDRRRVTVFLPAERCGTLLDNLRANGAIAVVAVRPSTHESIQLKGTDAVIGPLQEGDDALMTAHLDQFVADLGSIGYSEAFARRVIPDRSGEIVAVAFTPLAVFQQTPGPDAGRRLESPTS